MDSRNIKGKVINDLAEGYELAAQLQVLLHKPSDQIHGCGASADELVVKILRSFDETISALSSLESVEAISGNHQGTSCDDSPAFYDGRSEDSGESRKRMGFKEKRGCYKRKKKPQSRTVVSDTLKDAHAWRKYGQKEILKAKFPRAYFRCTHKYTQGCKAAKRVQKLKDDPKMYQITYIGDHTCDNHGTAKMEPPEMITDSDNPRGSYVVFSNTSTDHDQLSKQHDHGNDTDPEVKEGKEMSSDDQDCLAGTDLSYVWKDLMPFEESEPMYSCSETNSHGMDMEFVVSSSSARGFDWQSFPF